LKLLNKINWAITWGALAILKRTLQKRVEGDNKYWLQNVRAKNISIFNRVDFITKQCLEKKVLHIGFSDYPYTAEKINNNSLLHLQLKNITGALIGLDNNKEELLRYKQLTNDENVLFGDIMDGYPLEAINFRPGIVLLSEVLEHLPDPYKAVDILYNSFADGTKVLVTVPNHMALDNIAASVHKSETIHPHHCWHFSPFTLCKLFDDKRFYLEQLHFGMYYQPAKKINGVMRSYPYSGDCIMAIFLITKT
jgi:hypothetical protein